MPHTRARTDSARGRVVLTGPDRTGFIMLQRPDSEPLRLGVDGAPIRVGGFRNAMSRVKGLEIVVFGKRHGRGPFPTELQLIDSFFVRAGGGYAAVDGILRRSPGGDTLELRDGRRLAIGRLPDWLAKSGGMRVWIAGPLDAPITGGVIDPTAR